MWPVENDPRSLPGRATSLLESGRGDSSAFAPLASLVEVRAEEVRPSGTSVGHPRGRGMPSPRRVSVAHVLAERRAVGPDDRQDVRDPDAPRRLDDVVARPPDGVVAHRLEGVGLDDVVGL